MELSKKKLSEKREFKKSETKKSCLEENYIEKSIQEENISKVEEDVEKVEKSMTEKLEPIEVNEISWKRTNEETQVSNVSIENFKSKEVSTFLIEEN